MRSSWNLCKVYSHKSKSWMLVNCGCPNTYYHKLLPKGTVSYQCEEGYQINENLESYQINWDMFVNKIDDKTSEESVWQVAKSRGLLTCKIRDSAR
jgi:hypothetical protein